MLRFPKLPMIAGTKGGIFPMHSWLPDAHGRAPSEISAMFSAVLLPIAVYAIYIIIKTIDITLIFLVRKDSMRFPLE